MKHTRYLHDLEKVDKDKFFQMLPDSSTRGHSYKIYKPGLIKNLRCRKEFFTQRVIEDWNKLPTEVVNADSVNSFKGKLQKYWKSNRYGVLKAST